MGKLQTARGGKPRDEGEAAVGGQAERATDHAQRLDRMVHEHVRLGLLAALAVSPSLSFSELKRLLKTSDGNLSVHARKLEEAGYLECFKSFEKRLPRTDYRLTAKGRRALARYLDHMEALIRATRQA